MSDIKFNCQSCNTELEAPAEMAGEVVECPSCSQNITIPNQSGAVDSVPPTGNSSNACSNCQVEMDPDTILCVNCGFHKGLGKVIKTDLS
jgi:DNA-directed RNA polymerase subunit RPC12/RpoP